MWLDLSSLAESESACNIDVTLDGMSAMWRDRFYTYGNFPLDEHLRRIDEQVLSRFQRMSAETSVPSEPRWRTPVMLAAAAAAWMCQLLLTSVLSCTTIGCGKSFILELSSNYFFQSH